MKSDATSVCTMTDPPNRSSGPRPHAASSTLLTEHDNNKMVYELTTQDTRPKSTTLAKTAIAMSSTLCTHHCSHFETKELKGVPLSRVNNIVSLSGSEQIAWRRGRWRFFVALFHPEAVRATGRKKLVLAGLLTEVCVLYPALNAQDEGYEV